MLCENVEVKTKLISPLSDWVNILHMLLLHPFRKMPSAAHAWTYEDMAAHMQSSLFSHVQVS